MRGFESMEKSAKILSDVTVFGKYARYLPEHKRRETWTEIVDRNKGMHLKKFPNLIDQIEEAYELVMKKEVLPSMRSLQFAGKAIEVNPSRINNCSYLPVDHPLAFSEIMFLLLGGTGVGYSVQFHHIEKLPSIRKPQPEKPYGTRRYLIGDSIEGWADSIKVLIKSYFSGGPEIVFDYSDIRKKGARLVTAGGKAPGPEPLKICHAQIRKILNEKEDGDQLKSIEIHDIICHIADAVLSGGIRRAALISFFSMDDEDMLSAKAGDWYVSNPQRARSNNSAVVVRHLVKKEAFDQLWERIKRSGSGEPGIYFTNDRDILGNPCVEIALKPFQFCNLTTLPLHNVRSQEDLEKRVRAASFIGTLQASYTDFHYLRPIWKKTTEKEALIGVSLTGIGASEYKKFDLKKAAEIVVKTNIETAKLIGINPAARCTAIKPEGTSSCVLGCPSGIHACHSRFVIRRQRLGKNEAIYNFFKIMAPELLEDDLEKPHLQSILALPLKYPENAIFRNEPSLDLLERVKYFNINWIKPGHVSGANTHNISCTVSIKQNEWDEVGEWMWINREFYNGLSVLPYDDHCYVQPPFEECSEKEYEEMMEKVVDLDFSMIIEDDDLTDLKGEIACAGNACEVK